MYETEYKPPINFKPSIIYRPTPNTVDSAGAAPHSPVVEYVVDKVYDVQLLVKPNTRY